MTRREARAIADAHGLVFFEDDGRPFARGQVSSDLDVDDTNSDSAELDELVYRLGDPNLHVRLAAAQALGDSGNRSAVPSLLPCLRARDELMQVSALKALAALGDPAATAAVAEIAAGAEPFGVRATAAETLAALGDQRAPAILAELLVDPANPYPRSYAKWASRLLIQLRAVETIPALRAAQQRTGWRIRRRLERTIRTLESVPSDEGELPGSK
jgi:HEAT repeat protein